MCKFNMLFFFNSPRRSPDRPEGTIPPPPRNSVFHPEHPRRHPVPVHGTGDGKLCLSPRGRRKDSSRTDISPPRPVVQATLLMGGNSFKRQGESTLKYGTMAVYKRSRNKRLPLNMQTAIPRQRQRDRTERPPRFGRLAALVILLVAGASARAEPPTAEVWLIDTRAAARGTASNAADSRLRFWHLADGAWAPASREAFQAGANPDIPTVFLVHGNRFGPNDAIEAGCSVYRHLRCASPDRPFRLAIWSWPSEQMCRRVRADVQLKAHYSDVQAIYLAECLRELAADTPVTLVGYSFGARIITGALELLGGGRVGRYHLAKPVPTREAPWRAVLIAAALDAHWLSPGQRHGRALGRLDQALVTLNPADRVMRLYPRMYGRRGPQALGQFASGYATTRADQGKIQRLNVSCPVGAEHGWWSYWRSGSLRAALVKYALESPGGSRQPPHGNE